MPTKRKGRTAHRKAAHAARVKVSVKYHHRAAVQDRHLHTKYGMAYAVFAIALAIGVTAFYDASYYNNTGFAVLMSSTPNYMVAVANSGGGTGSSTNYKLTISTAEPLMGTGSSAGYKLTLGALAFLSGDTTPPTCTITQSTGSPEEGSVVTLTAKCNDDTALATITLYTDESGAMVPITGYGSPASVSGTDATTAFTWSNAAIKAGTTISWKAIATDADGNDGTTAPLAFTMAAKAVTPPSGGGATGGGSTGGSGTGTGILTDTVKPTADLPIAYPAAPTTGATVRITSNVADDTALSTASLVVNNLVVGTKMLTGTKGLADFSWPAGKQGTYTIEVAVSDAVGNTAKSPTLKLSVTSAACDAIQKPADLTGECKDGAQTVTTYVCNDNTGKWDATIIPVTQPCGAPTVTYIAVGLVAFAVAGAAAYYVLKVRPKAKMQAPVETPAETPEAPATFG